MALRSITDTVHTLYDGVHGCIVTDGIVSAIEVVVDGTRQTDAADVKLACEVHRTGERTVTTDYYQSIDFLFLDILESLLSALCCHEFLRTCSLQHRTAGTDDTAHVLCGESLDLVVDQSIVTTIDTLHGESVVDSRTGHRTDRCVHTRSIASRSQNTYSLNLCHNYIYLIILYIIDTLIKKYAFLLVSGCVLHPLFSSLELSESLSLSDSS